jgi:hypothetical protein
MHITMKQHITPRGTVYRKAKGIVFYTEGPINHWKFKNDDFILHILHSLFDRMLYSVYVHSKNNIPILYGSI